MTTPSHEDIIRMAREAGATPYTNRHYPDRATHTFGPEQLERFFQSAYTAGAEAMRERCAKVADYNGMPRISSIIHNITLASTSPHNQPTSSA